MKAPMRWAQAPGTEANRFGAEFVLLDPSGQMLRGLNESAALLWGALAQPSTDEALAQALVERYGITHERALADVRAFLAACELRGLVVRSQQAPGS